MNRTTPFTQTDRILAVLLAFGFILGFLLTPLGVETRMHEIRTLAFAGFFITVGLLLPLAGLVALWLKQRKLAGILAVLDAVILFLTAPADQAAQRRHVLLLRGVGGIGARTVSRRRPCRDEHHEHRHATKSASRVHI